ncbi:hypothetical protein WAI453_010455 [Rhynchosporium graminicola]
MSETRVDRFYSAFLHNFGFPTEEELNGGWITVEKAPIQPTCSFQGTIQCQRSTSGEQFVSQPSASTVALSKRAASQPENVPHHKKPRLFNSLGNLVSLRVGIAGAYIGVHRDVLLSASPGLSDMCKNCGSPADPTISLLNECPDTMQSLCYWMYHNYICISQNISQRSNNVDPLNTAPGLFIKLYIAAAKFSMPLLCNDAIDALLCCAQTIDLVSLSTHVYANTKPGSNLRKLLVKVISRRCNADDLVSQRQLIRTDFLFDLAEAAFKDRDQGFNRFRDRLPPQEGFCAAFHVHEKGEGRCEMMKVFVVADEERP